MKNTITLDKVKKCYGDLCVIDDMSLTIAENTAVMGPSGGGKTTLLRMIAGLERPDTGAVRYAAKPRFSVVFQEDRLFEDFSAVENVTAIIGRDRRAEAADVLSELLIDPSELDKSVRDYSGGMKRRVAIARALLAEHDVLLLDEPFKGLDEDTRDIVAAVISRYSRDKLVILVTHDPREADLLGIERVVTIE